GNLSLAVAVERDLDRDGRRGGPLVGAEGERVGGDHEVVAPVGLDPQPDLFEGGPVEGHVNGNAFEAGEARGVHVGDDVGVFAWAEVAFQGSGADATAGDADAADVDGAAGVVDDVKGVAEGRAARDGAEVLGQFLEQAVGPRGR